MPMRKLFAITALILSVFLIFSFKAEANEGVIELDSARDTNPRCFVMSTLVDRSRTYNLLVTCKNLVYPIEGKGRYYILWSVPEPDPKDDRENDNQNERAERPVRIGDIKYGKEMFKTRKPFRELFITVESERSPREPSNNRIMEGFVDNVEFLEGAGTDEMEESDITPSPTFTPATSVTPTKAPENRGGGIFPAVITVIVLIITIIFILGIVIYIINKVRNS